MWGCLANTSPGASRAHEAGLSLSVCPEGPAGRVPCFNEVESVCRASTRGWAARHPDGSARDLSAVSAQHLLTGLCLHLADPSSGKPTILGRAGPKLRFGASAPSPCPGPSPGKGPTGSDPLPLTEPPAHSRDMAHFPQTGLSSAEI